MSTDTLTVLTVILAVVVIAVLAVALVLIRRGLEEISQGLGTLHSALQDVESQHLRPLDGAVRAINAQFDIILGALPGIARKAAIVLLVVVVPVVVVLLNGVLQAARSIVPSVEGIAAVAAAGSKDLDAVPLLLTTQQQIEQTVAGLADYGGSLDVILDDAEPAR